MSQLHTYKSYIEFLRARAQQEQLDDLAMGILNTHSEVQKLKAELKAKDEESKSWRRISEKLEHEKQALKGK